MNWEFIGKYLPMYEKAALLTVKIGVIGILFAILLGLVCAAIQYYKVPVFYLLRISEDWDPDVSRGLRCGRTGIFRWQLYGGGIPQRSGGRGTDPE